MTHKTFFLVVLVSILGSGLFAADFSLSAGAGGLLGYTFTRYTLEGTSNAGGAVESLQGMDRFNYGGFVFFDATYGELAVVVQGGTNSYHETMNTRSGGVWSTLTDNTGAGTEMSVGFSLLGKYPFGITSAISLFPLVGIEYHLALLEWRKPDRDMVYDRTKGDLAEDRDKDDQPYSLSAWNSLWITIGAGLDYAIFGAWYIRGEVLFGFRLPTGYENGALEMMKKQFDLDTPTLAGLTGSPTIKIAIGYRFFKPGAATP